VAGRTLRSGESTRCKNCAAEARVIDLAGQKIGKWTVLSRAKGKASEGKRGGIWLCECECGWKKKIKGASLRFGQTSECRQCSIKSQGIDLTGQKKGKWTVLSRVNGRPKYWNCRCSCGNEAQVLSASLLSGDSRGCRRCHHKSLTIDMTGRKIGKWTVISQAKKKVSGGSGVFWLCKCECGRKRNVSGRELRDGNSKGCRKCYDESRRLAASKSVSKIGNGQPESLRAKSEPSSATTNNLESPKGQPNPSVQATSMIAPKVESPNQGEQRIYAALGNSVVDFTRRRIVRGTEAPIELGRSDVQWHIFCVALAAYPNVASMDEIWDKYPGEKDNVARKVNTNLLNKKLARIGLCVRSRQLCLIR
jgi:hypothetical protein